MANHSMWMNENKSPAKRLNSCVTLEIVLIFPGLPMFFHSCVNNSAYSKPWCQGYPSAKTVMLSAWEWPLSLRWSKKGESEKEGYFLWRKQDSTLFIVTSFTIPGNGRHLWESRDFYNSFSLASEATPKWLTCLKDRSITVCVVNHLKLSPRR